MTPASQRPITPADIDIPRTMRFWEFILVDLCLLGGGSLTGGPRTLDRNELVGGHKESRHLFQFGHGMAADLMFDSEAGRDRALTAVHARGYHPFVGITYARYQLHVQCVPPGVKILRVGESPVVSS